MTQLVVRNLEDEVRDALHELAVRNGHSMEEEIRAILRAAANKHSVEKTAEGLGTRIAKRFAEVGWDVETPEWRGGPARPPEFTP